MPLPEAQILASSKAYFLFQCQVMTRSTSSTKTFWISSATSSTFCKIQALKLLLVLKKVICLEV